ncbi:uncharacterized protein LOC123562346 [Mercenaria mercenaria]|uniref:uncharacterized protein LOC123562346 n=1 Tax=Mercenaria mercenaria TaxID=6596 RepID=UPI00234F8341|nr:uncharacterized protein LOC123562346 [Mercenaria mercenaria]
MVTADLKDGFFHVPVHVDHQDYLGFQFDNVYYKWQVLPFGHSCSPFFFAKTLRPIIDYLRSLNIRVVVYVDDFIVLAPKDLIEKHKNIVLSTLESLGFTINYKKSSLEPALKKVYLGYIIDNSNNRTVISIVGERISKLKRLIRSTVNKQCVQARTLARIAGQCVSMYKCIFPAKLLLRNIYRLLSTKVSWSDKLKLNDPCIKDLQWWLQSIDGWNRKVVYEEPIDLQSTTDASKFGWGGWINHSLQAQGFWDPWVQKQSSNYRELLSVLMCLVSFHNHLGNKHVQILSDNVTTVAMINGLEDRT